MGEFFQKNADKLLFALALAVLAALILRPGDRIGALREPTPGIVSIVFTHWWQDKLKINALSEIIKKFESQHEGIKIVLTNSSYDDLRNALFSPAAGEYRADVFALDPLWIPELLEKGIIEAENPGIENPLLSFINVLYYNIEILREAGFSRPPRNRTEFINQARALPGNVYGLAIGGGSFRGIYDCFFPWIWAAGAVLINNGRPALNARAAADSFSFFASLHSAGLIRPGALYMTAGEKLEDFVSGRAAFMIAPASDAGFVRERMGAGTFDVTSVPVPDNYAGRTFFASAGWTAGVYAGSPRKEEAGLFVNFLAEKALQLSEKINAIPGSGGPPPHDPFYLKLWDIAIASEAARDFTGIPFTELEIIFREELSALFEETATPAATAAAIQRRWAEKM